jgi:hypothetical protein
MTPAYLLQLQALHQHFHHYIPTHSYLPGPLNSMADDASHLWHLSDPELLTHFNSTYPQHHSWQLCHPTLQMISTVISMLCRWWPWLGLFLVALSPPTLTGTHGVHSAKCSIWTLPSHQSRTQFLSSKSMLSATILVPLHPITTLSVLEWWRTCFMSLDKHLQQWGPMTLT